MSACHNIGVLIDGFHDGELGRFERWRVQRHLAVCGACRDELASLAQLGGWVRVAVSDAPAAESWDAIERRLPLPGPVRKPTRRRSCPRVSRSGSGYSTSSTSPGRSSKSDCVAIASPPATTSKAWRRDSPPQ